MSAETIALRLVIGGDSKGAQNALDGITKKSGGMGKALKAAQTGAAIGLTAIVGIVGKGVQSYETLTASVAALQRQSKISAEDASLLTGQWARYGVTAEAGGKGVMMLSKQIDAANTGTQTSIDSFARLGITLNDLKTMSPYQVLEQVRSTLSAMPPSAERTALSAKLLGRGFMSMSKWIAASSTDLAEVNQRIKDAGLVMNDKELAKAKEDAKQMALLRLDLQGLSVEVGRSAMPIIRDLVPGLKTLLAVAKPLAPHLVQIGAALATFLVVSKVATGLNAMITALRTVKGLGKGLGNVIGGGGLGGAVSSGPLDAAISANTVATEANTLALGGKGIPGGGGGGVLNKVLPVAEGAGGMTLGAAIGTAAGTGIAAGLTLIAPTVIADTLGKNSKAHQEFIAAGTEAGKAFATTGFAKGSQAALILAGQTMNDTAAALKADGANIARSLRASGDKAGAGLASGLAHGVGPALQSIQKVRNSAGRPIHMGRLDATQMINEIARVSRALGGMSSAARTAGNAAANAVRSPSGGGGSYRGHFMARGGDFMVRRPTLFVAGEAGLERATFTPQGKEPPGTSGGTTVVHNHFHFGQIIGTDERAARKLADQVGQILMSKQRMKGAMSRG
jgi:hypothetical protein